MRVTGLERLSTTKLSLNQADYLVMYHLINDLKAAVENYGKGKVLDVGCGNKPYAHFFNDIETYVGCDVVQSSLAKVDYICKATELCFENASFDTVFTTQVIEHVEDPFKMISEMYRVLKPGGCLILSAPFAWEIHEAPYDFYRYSRYGLEYMTRSAGFDLISCKSNGGKWAAIMQLNLNIVYSTFKKKSFFVKILKVVFIHFKLTRLINAFARWFDKKYFDDQLTLNYVIVARKGI